MLIGFYSMLRSKRNVDHLSLRNDDWCAQVSLVGAALGSPCSRWAWGVLDFVHQDCIKGRIGHLQFVVKKSRIFQ